MNKVKKYFLFREFLKFFFILVCVWYAINLFRYGYRNYQGYCSQAQSQLSDSDRIDRAIEYLLKFYPKDEKALNILLEHEHAANSELLRKKNPIIYEGISDFKEKNDGCCNVLAQSDDIDAAPTTFLEKISGTGSFFVKVNYRIRYLDEFKNEKQQEAEVTYAISNCGVVSNN